MHSVPEGLQPGRERTSAHRVCHSPNRGGIIGISLDESKCRARPLAPLAARIPPGTFGPWEGSTQGANGGRYPSRPAHEARHTGRGAPGLRGRGRKLCSPNLDVAVQEDFGVGGGTTLEKLDTYIRHCDAVIHLIGKAAGAVPEGPAVAALLAEYPDLGARLPPLAEDLRKPRPGFSYTQWEAYLAIYHRRPLFVYRSTDFELDALHVPRDARFGFSPSEAEAQKEHYRRISALGHDRGLFLNEERLSSAVLRDLVEILPRLESTGHDSDPPSVPAPIYCTRWVYALHGRYFAKRYTRLVQIFGMHG